ncbi:MAG: PQQ-like beta-propeller repeat protein [Verrucomicrobia bacterium]|nr:PQQ-like beta-propeller repeat protein [Verrucomicrobiota bacterium]
MTAQSYNLGTKTFTTAGKFERARPSSSVRGALLVSLACGALSGLWNTQAAPASDGQNWPQWRGPLLNGVAPHGDPPAEWSETKNVKWKVKIPGEGDSTPIIWGDKIFILSAIPTGKRAAPAATPPPAAAVQNQAPPQAGPAPGQGPERGGRGGPRGGRGGGMGGGPPNEIYQWAVLCLDRNTGKLLWQKTAREELPHEGRQQNNTYASYSPVTDGEQLYVSFGSWGVYCFDLNGNLKWERDLGKMRTTMGFGEGGSPAVHGDRLVINWDHTGEDFITALDTRSGKTLWKTDRSEAGTWCTPLVVEHEGKAQVVVPASGKTRGYDLATGSAVWECEGLTANVIPTPVAGHGVVYAMSGFRGNKLLAIRLGRTGDLTGTDAIVWRHDKSTPYVPSPLLYEDLLYFFGGNNNILSCFEANTGKALIDAQRVEGIGELYASPVGAAGRVYIVGRDGRALVIKKSPQFEVVASNKLEDRFDASPAIVGNQLFLRGRENLYCIAAN